MKLLPCPFCGGEPVATERNCNLNDEYDPTDRAYPIVKCTKCFAEAFGRNWSGIETAIEAWNKRV